MVLAAIKSIEIGPPDILSTAKLRGSLVNMPKLGTDDNVYFGTTQLNIAQAECHGQAGQLKKQLGPFGGKHVDSKDHPASYTNMIFLSHLPSTYHPGLFFLYELGAYIHLDPFISVNFSGLRFHGGTAPTAPPGERPVAWGYHLTHISYPAHAIIDMSVRQALATLPGGTILHITPEMQEHMAPNKKYMKSSNYATYIKDGEGMMSWDAHVELVGRMTLRLAAECIIGSQFPEAYKVHINPTKFLDAIEYEGEEGESVHVQPWEFGECLAHQDADQQQCYKDAWNVVDKTTTLKEKKNKGHFCIAERSQIRITLQLDGPETTYCLENLDDGEDMEVEDMPNKPVDDGQDPLDVMEDISEEEELERGDAVTSREEGLGEDEVEDINSTPMDVDSNHGQPPDPRQCPEPINQCMIFQNC
ncbi:hypothetical protein K439DRAFT_1622506 [Ramaria rubella]|nr:hypothetical protein K439DRAFT_1622506 [Ramaria rubella]